MKKILFFIFLRIVLSLSSSSFLLAQDHLSKLTFAPHWLPQAQFAGYYIAQERGFYRDEGLDVTIIHPSANLQATTLLLYGKADLISLFLVTAMAVKESGFDFVNIGQTSQHSAILIVTKKSSGIDKLEKLNGKRVGVWKSGFDEVPKALLAEKGVKVEWVPILSTVNLFMMDGIDALTIMSYNEYNSIINCGIDEDELNVFPMSEFGYDIPEDGVYALKKTVQQREPELRKFMKATMQGWSYVSQNRDYSVDIVLKRMQQAHIPANRAHQEWMLNKVLEAMDSKEKKNLPGELLPQDFQKTLRIINPVGGSFTIDDFHKPLLK